MAAAIVFVIAIGRSQWYFVFDPKHNPVPGLQAEKGTFEPHSARYQDLAKLVITLSVGAMAFLINTVAGLKPPTRTDIQSKVADVTPIAAGFFGISTWIAFILLQTIFYEAYCHSPNHDSYQAWKYVLCIVLGWTGLVAFICGFAWVAANVL